MAVALQIPLLTSEDALVMEVYLRCPLETLVERDVKGLHQRAMAGEIPNFTGVSDPYEAPLTPEVTIHSARETPEEGAGKIWAVLEKLELIS